jgi:hypothetical protein
VPIAAVLLERERRVRGYMNIGVRTHTLYAHLARCCL